MSTLTLETQLPGVRVQRRSRQVPLEPLLALIFLALVGLSLLSQRVAQRLASPLVALGNRINDRSYRHAGGFSALLAGLAIGLLWAPCAGPVLGAILSFAFLNGQSVTTGLLLAAIAAQVIFTGIRAFLG